MQTEKSVDVVPAPTFPPDGKRIVFYLLYDRRGEVDDYIPYKLERLREHTDYIFVVVNGALTDDARARLESVADIVWQRPNTGFDVWGYKEALEQFGDEALSEYDELILMNYTWFGPVRPFGPLFERMNQVPAHFWGMTDHAKEKPNPFTKKGIMHRHIQSHWIAVRREMFLSDAWRDYWGTMKAIRTYVDSILSHESRFTHHFEQLGMVSAVAFSHKNYGSKHPALVNADVLINDGCPVLKRRPFFHYPPYLDQHAVIGRWTLERAEHFGYPIGLALQNLTRNSQPRELHADASMLEILPDVDTSFDESRPPRVVAVVHLYYEEMTDELMDRLVTIPVPFDVVITTTSQDKATIIRQTLERRNDAKVLDVDIRVLPSNRGRDLSAFFIGAKDVLEPGRYDLVVKIHSKQTVQGSFNAGRYFKLQQLDNVLNSDGFTANAFALFQKEPGLGIVFPPMIHIGYPTMGRGWYANREPAEKLAKELGIRVPFDDISPLAPYGCMWIARPEALRILVDHPWRYDQYAPADKHFDGSLAHVQERLIGYAAAELGYHIRTIASLEQASISHTALDFKLDQMGATMPGYAIDQIQFLHRAGWLGGGSMIALGGVYLKLHHPRMARVLEKPARAVVGRVRRLMYVPGWQWLKRLRGDEQDTA